MSRKHNNVERAFQAYLTLDPAERQEFAGLCRGFERGLDAITQTQNQKPMRVRRAQVTEKVEVQKVNSEPQAASGE